MNIINESFATLKNAWSWQAIPHCPGRYTLVTDDHFLTPQTLLGQDFTPQAYHSLQVRDTIIIVKLQEGGLISYQRKDGTYLHTLNTPSGFQRKLQQLNLEVS